MILYYLFYCNIIYSLYSLLICVCLTYFMLFSADITVIITKLTINIQVLKWKISTKLNHYSHLFIFTDNLYRSIIWTSNSVWDAGSFLFEWLMMIFCAVMRACCQYLLVLWWEWIIVRDFIRRNTGLLKRYQKLLGIDDWSAEANTASHYIASNIDL